MITSLATLSSFLHEWYGEPDGALALAEFQPIHDVAPPLREHWSRVGKLLLGEDQWRRWGTRSPLACQDGLASPVSTNLDGGLIHFLGENQGNWSMAYQVDDRSADPPVLCNAVELTIADAGHVRVGATLTQVLITSALVETAFFGESRTDCAKECGEHVWCGGYYNAPGYKDYDGPPSHRFTTNEARTLLNASIGEKFRVTADRAVARENWLKLKSKVHPS